MSPRAAPLVASLVAVATLSIALCACTTPDGPSPSQPRPAKTAVEPPSPSVTVEPVLVVASVDVDGAHVTASGYVQGIVADEGTCVYVFTRDGSSPIAVERDAVADRSTTSCGMVQPDAAEFARGSWTVTLRYESGGRDYESAPAELEVP
ncbi:hypothetical protein [Leifsonia aquatica]|uniref:hypothetical protein n=1 Tax=Leifsonia aquatica TaxID=144185 RepID=UPI0028AE2669|nr:hypothetical protein [Leifsonia aquatica]